MLKLLKTRQTTSQCLIRAFSTVATPDLEVDNLVIGAGVVGLAIGEKLTRERPHETTFVIEKNKRIGEETRQYQHKQFPTFYNINIFILQCSK